MSKEEKKEKEKGKEKEKEIEVITAKKEKEKEKGKEKEKEIEVITKEIEVITAVYRINLHCPKCAHDIRRPLLRISGMTSISICKFSI